MFQWTTSYRAGSLITLNKTERLPRIRNGKFIQASLIFLTLTFLGVTMVQAQASLEDLQKRKTIAEAEKAAIEAETALDTARKKQSELAAPIDAAKKAKDDALESANSAKAIAEAKKAQSEAELSAFKAQFGEIPDSGIKGSVELGDKAGSMETALLAAHALATASEKISEAIKASLNQSGNKVFIAPSGEALDFKALSGFRALRPYLLNQFTSALAASEKAKTFQAEVLPVIPAIGVALSTLTKLLSFFASDFKVGGSDLTPDSILLAEAVGGKLQTVSPGTKIFLKGVFNPVNPTAYDGFFAAELRPLSEQYEKVVEAIREREHDISSLAVKLAKITGDTPDDDASKLRIAEETKPHQGAIEKLKSTAQAYEAFMTKLTGSDGGLEVLFRQFEMSSLLSEENSYLLIVKLHKAGGSHYVEKNLWTSFWKMPFQVMGGVVASYSLFNGKSGSLVMSGVVPVHGGFHNVKKLEDQLK